MQYQYVKLGMLVVYIRVNPLSQSYVKFFVMESH